MAVIHTANVSMVLTPPSHHQSPSQHMKDIPIGACVILEHPIWRFYFTDP